MRETISILLMVLIVFFLLAAILDVLFGLAVAILVFLWLVIVYLWPTNAINNHMDISIIAVSYAALMTAILGSWGFRMRDTELTVWTDIFTTTIIVDLLSLTALIIVGGLIAILFNLTKDKEHPVFGQSKPKRFEGRRDKPPSK